RSTREQVPVPVHDVAHLLLEAMDNIEISIQQVPHATIRESLALYAQALLLLNGCAPLRRRGNVNAAQALRASRNVIDDDFSRSRIAPALEQGDVEGATK